MGLLSSPGALAALAALKGVTGAAVSEQERRRAQEQKERERAQAFQDNLSLMSARQKMELATTTQNEEIRNRGLRDQKLWERSLPPTPAEQSEIDWRKAQATRATAEAAGVETPAQLAERKKQEAQARVDKEFQDRVDGMLRNALDSPDAARGLGMLQMVRGQVPDWQYKVAEATLREREKTESHRREFETAQRLLADPNTEEADYDRIKRAFRLTAEEMYQLTMAPQFSPPTPMSPQDAYVDVAAAPAAAPPPPVPGPTAGMDDATRFQMAQGAPSLPGSPAVAPMPVPRVATTSPPTAPTVPGGGDISPADIAEFRRRRPDMANMSDEQIRTIMLPFVTR